MRIRTKVWLLVAGTVVLTACVGLVLLRYGVRIELSEQSRKLGNEVAKDLVMSLQQLSADAEDRDLAITVYGFLERHPRIQRLQLLVEREAPTSPSFRIDAPKGASQPELTRLGPGPAYRESEHLYGRQETGQEEVRRGSQPQHHEITGQAGESTHGSSDHL